MISPFKPFNSAQYYFQLLLILLSGLISSYLQAEEISPVVLTDTTSRVDIGQYLVVLEDKTKALMIDDIAAMDNREFTVNKEGDFYAGFSPHVYWLRFDVKDARQSGLAHAEWILELDAPILGNVVLYIQQGGDWQATELGAAEPFSQRKYKRPAFLFDLSSVTGTIQRYYIRIETSTVIDVPMFISAVDHYFDRSKSFDNFWGMYFGISFIMLLYNFLIWLSIRDKSYFYYLLYMSNAILILSTLNGYTFQYIWPNWPKWNELSLTILTGTTLFFGSRFAREYLQTADISRGIDNLLKVFGVVVLVPVVLCLAFQRSFVQVSTLSAILFATVLLVSGVFGVLNGSRSAIFFLISWTMLLISIFIYSFRAFGIIPPSFFFTNAMHIGTAIEMVLLSLGLADRINTMKKEKIQLQLQSETAEKQKLFIETQNKAKNQFFASMSHELRTPLTAILGYAEMAARPEINEARRLQMVSTINRSGNYLLSLINDVLDLSKIEANKLDVELLSVDVIEVIRDIEDYFTLLAAKKGITFNKVFRFPLPQTVITDPTRLKQMLINLCGNAIKFTEQGSVTIETYFADNQRQLCFAISDTGIGLKPDQLEKLFGAFVQAGHSTSRYFGGTGIGLHLSKRIAEKLGGNITVDSVYGEGSTFTLTIACGDLSQVNWLDEATADNNRLATITVPSLTGNVLYAEDNTNNQQLIKELVERTGATIELAANGKEALDKALARNFDLVLTDIRMPIMDGIELTQALKHQKPLINVVAITAEANPDILAELDHIGVETVLEKPVSTSELYRVLSLHLHGLSTQLHSPQFTCEKFKVLLAEDDPISQQLIAFHIKRAGAEVILVNDGVEVLAEAIKMEFDLILLDLNIPIMAGKEVVEKLRAKGMDMPIYGIIAEDDQVNERGYYELGFNDVLYKPINTDKLYGLISQRRKLIKASIVKEEFHSSSNR